MKRSIRKRRVRVKIYNVLAKEIEERIAIGYRHAFKYTASPEAGTITSCIYQEVMLGLDEILFL